MIKDSETIQTQAFDFRHGEGQPFVFWREAQKDEKTGGYLTFRMAFDASTDTLTKVPTERFKGKRATYKEVKKHFKSFESVCSHPDYDYPKAKIPEQACNMA